MRFAGLVCLVVFGCGGAQTAQSPAAPPAVTVVATGAEPREVLRYELTPHAAERAEVLLKLRTRTDLTNTVLENGHQAVDFPSVRGVLRLEVTSVTPAGTADMAWALEDATVLDDMVDPRLRKQAELTAASMKGMHGSFEVTASGLISSATVDNAATIPGFSASSQDEWVVFPDAPIGVGASWQVRSQKTISGATWDRIATYRVKELTPSSVTLDASVTLHASSQPIRVEPTRSTRMTSGTGTGTAELQVPRHSLVPTSTSQATSDMSLEIVDGDKRIRTTSHFDVLSSIKPLTGSSAAR